MSLAFLDNVVSKPKQFLERLFTMFNILLMIAGALEYALLGFGFHVSPTKSSARLKPTLNAFLSTG